MVGREQRTGELVLLDDIKPLYFLPKDDLVEEVLVPCFKVAESVDCMMGFFSGEALAALAPGLASFINESKGTFRLIVSPYLRAEDQAALEAGLRSPEEFTQEWIDRLTITEDLLQRHTLVCLSYLLRVGRIDVRVALMKEALFHPKVWVFRNGSQILGAHGSSNATNAGIRRNFEQVTISKAWADSTQRYIVEKLLFQFERLWVNHEDDCVVIPLPEAIKNKLLRAFPANSPPTEEDFRRLYREALEQPRDPTEQAPAPAERPIFHIPSWLRYEDGPFEHQGQAVRAWCEAGFRGVLEMATGSGKTIASMVGAYRLFQQHHPLLIVIAAPYVPLIEQWADEISTFGLKATILTRIAGARARAGVLAQIKRRLRLGLSDVEVVLVSHDTLCTDEFLRAVSSFENAKLLIADEAHNLGRRTFVDNTPEFFEYRLALSATPVRQYDPEGTDAIFAFFGPVVFRFTLKEAIGRCLVEYDYYVHPVNLTATEMDDWNELTFQIRQNAWRQSDGQPDEHLARLFRERRKVLEIAQGKIGELSRLLEREPVASIRHTLIYATDKAPEQLDAVNALLNRRGVLFHQLTAEETAQRSRAADIIAAFKRGELQVLTAKRVLDEGVNIPEICTAYILASTTVERQWIQRRGRLLRTCVGIGKTHSVIHDFLALPPSLDGTLGEEARTLIKSELRRAQEFASLARNAGKPDGPLEVIHRLVRAAAM